jgi:DnaK suppressor protein
MNTQKQHDTLAQKLSDLEGRLVSVTKDITKTLSSDFAEQATERENDDVLEEIARETQVSIHKLRTALRRLEDDNYGVCASCGENISEQRLDVIPETTQCVACAD